MPGKMEIWRRKWAKKVEKRTLARQKILHEWVYILHPMIMNFNVKLQLHNVHVIISL